MNREEVAAGKALVQSNLEAILHRLDLGIAAAKERSANAHDALAARCHMETAHGAERLRKLEVKAAEHQMQLLDMQLSDDPD